MKHTYIEVISFESQKVVKRIEVTGKTEREIYKVDAGVNINLNQNQYYTSISDYRTAKPLEPINK